MRSVSGFREGDVVRRDDTGSHFLVLSVRTDGMVLVGLYPLPEVPSWVWAGDYTLLRRSVRIGDYLRKRPGSSISVWIDGIAEDAWLSGSYRIPFKDAEHWVHREEGIEIEVPSGVLPALPTPSPQEATRMKTKRKRTDSKQEATTPAPPPAPPAATDTCRTCRGAIFAMTEGVEMRDRLEAEFREKLEAKDRALETQRKALDEARRRTTDLADRAGALQAERDELLRKLGALTLENDRLRAQQKR